MVRLQLATRAEVTESNALDMIRAATRNVADGVGRFAKASSDVTSRVRTIESSIPDMVAAGWVSVPGFLVSREGHVFRVL
jgi:hypothetical protein